MDFDVSPKGFIGVHNNKITKYNTCNSFSPNYHVISAPYYMSGRVEVKGVTK